MTKKTVMVVSLLAVAFVGVLVWAIMTRSELIGARDMLSSTEAQLALTTAELEQTKDELTDTTNELTRTENELSSARNELLSTKDELSNTKIELSSTNSELSTTRSELTSTENELTSVNSELADTQQQLTLAQDTLKGLGITLLASENCYDVVLTDNHSATNPTWAQLKSFLSRDRTETHRYIPHEYDCSQFSRDIHNNAEADGIRAAVVHIDLRNESEGHALNAFLTTDYGLVYVDCTGGPDTVARIALRKIYRAVRVRLITATNIRNNYWWDSLTSFYYIRASAGGEAVVSGIRIFW